MQSLPAIAQVAADFRRRLPIADASISLALDVFAPRNSENCTVPLRRDAALLVVTPMPSHPAELRQVLGLLDIDPHKEARLDRAFEPYFRRSARRLLTSKLNLNQRDVTAIVAMDPRRGTSTPTLRPTMSPSFLIRLP